MASINSSSSVVAVNTVVEYPALFGNGGATRYLNVTVSTDSLVKVAKVTPNWKKLVKSGVRLNPLAYSIVKTSVKGFMEANFYDPGIARFYRTDVIGWTPYKPGLPQVRIYLRRIIKSESNRSYWWVSRNDFMLPPSPAPYITKCENIAKTKLLLKIKDSKANLIQAYAESSQVQRLIGDTTKRLASMYVNLRRGNLAAAGADVGLRVSKRASTRFKQSHSRAKTRAEIESLLANGVLAVQYGIRPLISDIIGTAELLAQKVSEEVVNSARNSHSMEFTESRSLRATSSYNAYEAYTASAWCETRIKVRTSVGVEYAKGSEVNHTLAQLGITNPLLLAWELLPWSFVIDWFLPIGNYISSMDATLGLAFRRGFVSTSYEVTHIRNQVVTGGVESQTSSSYSQKSFVRTPLTSFPTSSPPSFKNPLSYEHALNGIALLVGIKNKVISGLH